MSVKYKNNKVNDIGPAKVVSFEKIVFQIEEEYKENQNSLGWRFLNTSQQTLYLNNGIVLVTLNPGGRSINPDHGAASCEQGCSYLTEMWGTSTTPGDSKLQRQFKGLFKEIAIHLDSDDYVGFMENSLCGYFIAFRSPSWKSLKDRSRSITFARKLWKEILLGQNARLVICIDKVTHRYILEILFEKHKVITKSKSYRIGWGNVIASIVELGTDRTVRLLRLPHLSRFAIFGRENSKHYIDRIFIDVLKDLQ